MKITLNPYGNGWCDLVIGLKRAEIDELIRSLHMLKSVPDHFHGHATFKGDGGVADIEFSVIPDDAQDNTRLDSMG